MKKILLILSTIQCLFLYSSSKLEIDINDVDIMNLDLIDWSYSYYDIEKQTVFHSTMKLEDKQKFRYLSGNIFYYDSFTHKFYVYDLDLKKFYTWVDQENV